MVIERMICLSNGSTAQPVVMRQNDYNTAEIRLLVYETPDHLLDMTGMAAVVIYEVAGVPTDPYEATVEESHCLRFVVPGEVTETHGNGRMQIGIYLENSLTHSYMLPYEVEYSLPMPGPGTEADPAPAFFSLVKEAREAMANVKDGGYYSPNVDETGNLSWVGSDSDMPVLPTANIMGPKGNDGQKGDAGSTPIINASGNWEISGVDTGVKADWSEEQTNAATSAAAAEASAKAAAKSAEEVANQELTALNRESMILGLNTVPQNDGALSAIKRARQMTDVLWKPVATLHRCSMVTPHEYGVEPAKWFFDKFVGGVEYRGLPYSSRNWIGNEISFGAVVTASAKDNSIMITGTSPLNHDTSTFYGTVCTTLVSYALDIPIISSAKYADATPPTGFKIIQRIEENGAFTDLDGLKLCDVLAVSSHVALVTDIRRDGEGHVTDIEVSESTKYGNLQWHKQGGLYGGVCRRKWWTLAAFRKWFRIFDIRRYDALDTVTYTPNPYVPLPGEGDMPDSADMSCIPEYGHMHRIVLDDGETADYKIITDDPAKQDNYNSDPFDHLYITKDGESFDTQEIVDNAVTVALGSEGIYTAQMQTADPDNTTNQKGGRGTPCSWAVLRYGLSAAAKNGAKYRVTIRRKSAIAYPVCAVFNGDSSLFYKIPHDSVEAVVQSTTAVDYTFDLLSPVEEVTDIKVFFDIGEYGGFYEKAISPGITITSQPVNYVGTVGQTAVFTVEASGMSSYQWMWRNKGAGKWNTTTATGNKTQAISVEITAARLAYEYRCMLINADGTFVYTDPVKIVKA